MKRSDKLARILRARELRKEQTAAEKILWPYLRDRTFFHKKFRRQHLLRGFILDYFCPEAKLAIEIDGPIHSKTMEADLERQNIIEATNIKFLRFSNDDIIYNLKTVLRKIKYQLNPSPSKMEKGGDDKLNR